MIRTREYHIYKNDEEYFDYDLNKLIRTFNLELIKTEQLGEFEDGEGKIFYKVLVYFDIPEELELMEEFICDCTDEWDETGNYYLDYQSRGEWAKKAMKEIFLDRIFFEDGGNGIKIYVK